MPKIKIQDKFQISFCKIAKCRWYNVKVLLKRFHLNSDSIVFHPQTQKLEYLCISIIDSGSERVNVDQMFLLGYVNKNVLFY